MNTPFYITTENVSAQPDTDEVKVDTDKINEKKSRKCERN